jgi:hypothetical protein
LLISGVEASWVGDSNLPTNEYVEIREGCYYAAGTRLGMDVLIHDLRRGRHPRRFSRRIPPSIHRQKRMERPIISSHKRPSGSDFAMNIPSRTRCSSDFTAHVKKCHGEPGENPNFKLTLT